MPNLTSLRSAVANYEHRASPPPADPKSPATVEDLNRMVSETKKLFSLLLDVLSRQQ